MMVRHGSQVSLVTSALLLILVLAVSVPGLGATLTMGGGPHDFRNKTSPDYAGATATGNEVCRACHIPHNAFKQAFLWSRDYGTPAEWQSGSTELCMGCHDGQIASAVSGNPPVQILKTSAIITTASNSHKVNVPYPPTVNASNFNPNPGLPREGGQMTCGTCHDPHAPISTGGKWTMLRIDNAGSALCIECHLK